MAKPTASINLVKNRGSTFFDKFIKWALSIGRTLVILTEVIALSAFLYRFSLDRQIVDLHDKIKQKQVIIGLSKQQEDRFRNLQNKLSLLKTLNVKAPIVPGLLAGVVALAPNSLLIHSITVSETQIHVEATAQNISAVTTFVKGLKNYPNIQTVSLDKIENKTSNGTINISVNAKRKA